MKNKKENKKNSKVTNFTHGKVTVNNGDVKFGARKDTRDVETSSKSSGVNLSVRIKSEAFLYNKNK